MNEPSQPLDILPQESPHVPLKGGQKHQWLQLHRDEILFYYDRFGEAATMRCFNIQKSDTLWSILNPDGSEPQDDEPVPQTEISKLKAEITEEAVNELKGKVQTLEAQYERFVELVASQITQKFLIPLLSTAIKLPVEFEVQPKKDRLSLAGGLPLIPQKSGKGGIG